MAAPAALALSPAPVPRMAPAPAVVMAAPMPAPSPAPIHVEPFFMAPRAAEPEIPAAPVAAAPAPAMAEPYAAAAMANGAASQAEMPRGPRGGMAGLFKKVTGGARKPAEIDPEPIAPLQARLGGLDPTDRPAAARGEDDLLEIPAFLRRQAN